MDKDSPINEYELREEIAQEIHEAAHAGPALDELEEYWVAGMEYAEKIVRKET